MDGAWPFLLPAQPSQTAVVAGAAPAVASQAGVLAVRRLLHGRHGDGGDETAPPNTNGVQRVGCTEYIYIHVHAAHTTRKRERSMQTGSLAPGTSMGAEPVASARVCVGVSV